MSCWSVLAHLYTDLNIAAVCCLCRWEREEFWKRRPVLPIEAQRELTQMSLEPYPIARQLGLVAVIGGVCLAGWYGHAPAVSFLAERGWVDARTSKADKRSRRGSGRAVPVIVARTTLAKNDAVLVAVGTARAHRTASLYTQADGIVGGVEVKAGDMVNQGDTILRLDRSKAELAVAVARQKVAQAKRLRDRAAYLKRRSIQSNAKLDDTQNSLDVAELDLRLAEEALEDTVIVAPFTGVVSLPVVELGDRVTTSTRIASIDDRTQVLVEFEVPEIYFARLQQGMRVSATTAAYRGRTFQGRVSTIDAQINTTSRTVRVRATFPNGDDALRPGMSFSVQLAFPGGTHTAVPELALQYEDGQPFVWRVVDGRAARVSVTPVRRYNAQALVTGALVEGDLVVVEGVQRVREGRKLQFDPPPAVAQPYSDHITGQKAPAVSGRRG